MIIILEGPDGIGKTSFIEYHKALAGKNRKVHVFEYDNKFENTFDAWRGQLNRWVDLSYNNGSKKRDLVIVSRSWLSENVYAPVFNREPRMTTKEEQSLFDHVKVFRDHGMLIKFMVLLPKEPSDVYSRLELRGDYPSVLKNWWKILGEYTGMTYKYKDYVSAVYI